MCKILVVYHSQAGHTKSMAETIAQGAGCIEGVAVVLRSASEANLLDLLECGGLAIGSTEYFGYMAGMIKDLFDRSYDEARGRKEVFKKPYVVFVSARNDGTGVP